MIHTGNLENEEYPVVISYYTINTVYEEEIRKLMDSLNTFQIPYKIYGVPTLGSWLNNTGYKAEFVRDVLKRVDRPCVWLDADCEIIKQPVLFAKLMKEKVSMSVYIRGDEKEPNLNSSTIYLGNDAFCKDVVEKWVYQMKQTQYKVWDQKCLEYVYMETPSKFHKIPPEYAKKAKMGKKKTSVIFQNNISTTTRGGIIDTEIDILRYICSHDDMIDAIKNTLIGEWTKSNVISWFNDSYSIKSCDNYTFNPFIFLANHPEYESELLIHGCDSDNIKDHFCMDDIYLFYMKNKKSLSLYPNPTNMSHIDACEVIKRNVLKHLS